MIVHRVDVSEERKSSDVSFWIEETSTLRVRAPQAGELDFRVSAPDPSLYDYFPWHLSVYVNGELHAIVEFADTNRDRLVTVTLSGSDHDHEIQFFAEQAGSPSRRGTGSDQRRLSAHVSRIRFFGGRGAAQTPSHRPAPLRHDTKRHAAHSHERPAPVFVIGSYRAATSITTWAIGQHPNIFALEETNWLPTLYHSTRAAYQRAAAAARPATDIYDLSEAEFLEWQGNAIHQLHLGISRDRADYVALGRLAGSDKAFNPAFQIVGSRYSPKRRWVDGTPENTGIAIGLADMFPLARFIYCIRRPSLVIASLMNFGKAGGQDRGFAEAAAIWEGMNQTAYEAYSVLGPGRVLISDLAAARKDAETLVHRWWRFLGEPTFYWANDPLAERINSSGAQLSDLSQSEQDHLARLEAIYDQITSRIPFAEVAWSTPPDLFDRRTNHITREIGAVLSEPSSDAVAPSADAARVQDRTVERATQNGVSGHPGVSVSLVPGHPIHFGTGCPGNEALASGWSSPEQGQVWSVGGTTVLNLEAGSLAQARRLVLHATPKLPPPSSDLSLGVFGNGLLIGWCQLDVRGGAELVIPDLVARSMLEAGELELSFAIPDHVEGEIEGDVRRLGIALHSIEIKD